MPLWMIKSLYGLKQASRVWYSRIDKYFQEKKFERSPSDPNLYVKKNENVNVSLVSLYVVDLIIIGSASQLTEEI